MASAAGGGREGEPVAPASAPRPAAPPPAAAAPSARLHPLSLRISPPAVEAAFWRDVGTPAYAQRDRYGLAFTCLNTVAITWGMITQSSASTVLDTCSPAARAAIKSNHVAGLLVALPALAMALGWPSRYRAVREPLAILQRLMRAINTPLFGACTSMSACKRRIAFDIAAAQAGTSAALMPSLAVAKQICLYGAFWAIQILVFPFRIRWAAPVQAVTAVATGAIAARNLGCAIKTEPGLAGAAAQLCGLIEAFGGEAMSLGLPRGPCGDGATEFLVVFIFSASSLLPLYIIFSREEHLKIAYLRYQGHLPPDCGPGPLGFIGIRHAAAVVACAMISVLAADAAIALGWRYDCT